VRSHLCGLQKRQVHVMSFHAKDALFLIAAAMGVVVFALYLVLQNSPWPAALFYRVLFNYRAIAASKAIEKYVPENIASILNVQYDPNGAEALLDVFYPANKEGTEDLLPAILWIHGGGFLSGNKDQAANYLRILAAEGFTVVGVNYSLAPEATYPTPVKQINQALSFIEDHASHLHADASNLFIAGDSAGAQIAAQLANIISSPGYAQEVGITPSIKRTQVRGVILHSGLFGVDGIP
jgi:acetyl esterase